MYDLGGGVLLIRKGIIPVFVVILTILTILISMGYSALNQNLSVSGEAFLRSKGNVRISRIEMSNAENDGYETYNPEYSKKGTKTYSTLSNKNSTITYTVQITNTTGAKYTVYSMEISNTNSNVSCTPSITKGSIIEEGISDFTIDVKYNGTDSLTESIEDVCEIKYEFIPLDTTSPVLTAEIISQENKTAKLKITATDEDGGSGLSPDNIYKYCLSTSGEEAKECTWTNYISGEEFEVTAPSNGEYYLLVYSIGDKAGNISDGKESIGEATNKLYLPLFNKITDFEYTGNEQTYIVPTDGYYRIETWGAQGSDYGGKGSYTTGIIELKKNTNLYVIVGGTNGYNGGNGTNPTGGTDTTGAVKYGGGATDIRLTQGNNILETTSLNSRIMVAAGGGSVTNNESGANAGIGGTLYGIDGISHLAVIGVENTGNVKYNGGGATQTSGGSGATGATSGEFGYGGNFGAYTDGHRGSYGGGGYYGGGGSTWHSGSGGGSSFISGYAGVNAIASVNDRTPTNNTLHYSGKYFIDSNMEEDINEGNGKAKITYISKEKPERKNTKLDKVRYVIDCAWANTINDYSHWVEIQAISNGINVAKGKNVTGAQVSDNNYPLSRITDGDINSANYTATMPTAMDRCITIDLGQEYELDEVAIWHYWADKRTYSGHTTFVARDYSNWINITPPSTEEKNNGDRISAYEDEIKLNAYVVVNLLPDSSFELNQYNLSTSTKTNLTEGLSIATDFARNGGKSLLNYHNQQYASFYTGSIMDISAIPNDVYYARDWIYNIDLGQHDDNTKGTSYIDLSFYYDATEHWSNAYTSFSDGRLNSWHKVAIRRTAPSVNSKIVLAIGLTNSSNKQQHFYSDSVILLDLTKMFSSGNEPDIEWCNNNIPHIEGAKIIYLPKHSDYYSDIVNSNGGYRVNDGTYDLIMLNAKNGETRVITERRRTGYTLTGYTLTNAFTGTTTDLGGASITFDQSSKQAIYTQGTESLYITANWSMNNYALTINPNGGIYNGDAGNTVISIQYGSTTTLTNPTRSGYVFAGWTLSGAGSSLNGTTFTMGYENATLIANWATIDPVSLSYTGAAQYYTAPATGNYEITLYGAKGGNGGLGLCSGGSGGAGGNGGYVKATVRLTQGQTYTVWVGGKGTDSSYGDTQEGTGGLSDGVTGGTGVRVSGGGGGGGGSSYIALGDTVYLRANGGGGGGGGADGGWYRKSNGSTTCGGCKYRNLGAGGARGGNGGGGTAGGNGAANSCQASGSAGSAGTHYVNSTYSTVTASGSTGTGNGSASIKYVP